MTNSLQLSLAATESSIKEHWGQADRSAWTKIQTSSSTELERAIGSDEAAANRFWMAETAAEAHLHMCDMWDENRKQKFNKAWCALERAELCLLSMARNAKWNVFGGRVTRFRKLVSEWQKLYPYGVFASPEFLVHARKCSICDLPRTPFAPCGHRRGQLYGGQLCSDIVTKMDIVGMALVRDPVQKYSILEPSDESAEAFDKRHAVIRYAMTLLEEPWALSHVEKTSHRWPFSRFPDLTESSYCPCESGRAFGNCCRSKGGVLRPHLDIVIQNPPTMNAQRIVYTA